MESISIPDNKEKTNTMKRHIHLLLPAVLIPFSLACILQTAAPATLNPAQVDTLAAQTMAYLQYQTYAAAGTQIQPPANTSAPPPAGATPTDTMLPSVTQTGTPLPSLTFTPTASPTPLPCNWAQFVSDVTVPDNWETTPSDHFTKTWRLKNIGSCTWTSGYSLVFDHGDQMSAPASQQLTAGTVAPGGTIDVSVDLLSPAAPGTYQGFFKLRASDSSIFGIGPDHNTAFWVKIQVVAAPPPASPYTDQVFTQVSVASGTWGYAVATCPGGSVVVGGGYATNHNNVVVYNSSPSGNGWKAYAKNYSGSSQLLNAYAICLYNTAGSSDEDHMQKTIAPGTYGYDTVTCPAGKVVTGGGFASNPDTMWVYNTSKNGNGWRVYAKNISGSNVILTIYAVCLSGAGGSSTMVGEHITVPAGSTDGGEAQCPAGKLVTGGGYALSDNLVTYNSSMKPSDHSKWNVFARNTGAAGALMNIYAVCWTP
jgi:hypothetical protein